MPYNTRRKSLSLPALGIHLPNASRVHRASISKSIDDESQPQQPPAKRIKRSHSSGSNSPSSPISTPPSAVSSAAKTVTFADRPKSSGRINYEHTPPPSPGATHGTKIDFEGINDDIVTGVIEQLEKTGNRPHLIKELATVLSTTNDHVAGSANPAALLSSRLASYMKRPWTALAPCPVAKELIPVHPRKVFYYLTTSQRQELPDSSADILPRMTGGKAGSKRIISPSLSNASQDDDDPSVLEDRKRAALSPSPEVDLSFDLEYVNNADTGNIEPDFPTPGSSLNSGRGSITREGSDTERDLGLNRRAESPPLEVEEREFTHTAQNISMRAMSIDGISPGTVEEDNKMESAAHNPQAEQQESEEQRALRNSEEVAALFGPSHHQSHHDGQGEHESAMALSSPLFKPTAHTTVQYSEQQNYNTAKLEVVFKREDDADMDVDMSEDSILGERGFGLGTGWEIEKPENVCLADLDDLFGEF